MRNVDPLISLPNVKPHVNDLLFKNVSNPTADLIVKYNRILELAHENEARVAYIFDDMKRNNIVIMLYIKSRRRNKKFLNAIKSLHPTILYKRRSNEPPPLKLTKRDPVATITSITLLGERITSQDDYKFAIGFFAKDKTNPNLIYMVTAGHCASLNETIFYYGRVIGEVTSCKLAPFEYSLIKITDDNFKSSAIIKNTNSSLYNQLFVNDVTTPSSIGVHSCKSGPYSDVTCGNVISLNVLYKDLGEIQRTFITNMISLEGDSGSPTFSYSSDLRKVSLTGIVDGGYYGTTTVTSIKEILEHANLEPITHDFSLIN
ncbi:26924_t:CDS:2 [Racocetra persica]|uniref:26924_t:CDS:1 n=1 Tax=Racocetra persica TaxID=160502 RepID=A0ACA9MFK4_9GLOM|nr:26924_t:CDS:2 [Racocetra persica]